MDSEQENENVPAIEVPNSGNNIQRNVTIFTVETTLNGTELTFITDIVSQIALLSTKDTMRMTPDFNRITTLEKIKNKLNKWKMKQTLRSNLHKFKN